MPKKSNKGYDPVNLDNLEQAIKLWRELNAMHSDATKFVENYDKYMSKIDTLVGKQRDGNHRRLEDLEDELRHYRNIAQEQANIDKLKERELAIEREQREIEKERAKATKEQEKINRQNAVTMRRLNNYNRQNSTPSGTTQLGWGNFGEYITTNSSKYRQEYNRVYNHVYANVLSREQKAAAREGRAIDYNYIQSQTNDGVAKSLERSGFTKKMNLTAGIFQVAANTFKSAVDTIWKTFMAGSNNQKNIFEQTFEGISVRNGTTRKNYYDAQWKANNVLDSMGLFNNVDTAEIQKMWSTLATNGIKVDLSTEKSRADITARAIETILTNKIVPYLDVSSRSAQIIIDKNENFMKQVRGIGITTNELYGNSSFVTQHLQELVDDVAPMASLAEQELGLQFAQSSGEYAKMAAAGYTDAEIGEYYKNAAAVYRNPYQALKSGSLDQRLAVSRMISNGDNLSNWATVNTETTKATNELSNWVPEDNNATLYAGLLATKGIVGVSALTSARTNKINLSNDEIVEAGIKTANQTTAAGERATEDYKDDKNQTNMTREQVWLSNMSNELTTIREYLGIFENPITTLLTGIGTLFATWIGGKIIKGVIGKGIGAIAGSGAGGTGAGILAGGSTAGIALGVIGAAALAALGATLIQKEADKSSNEHGAEVVNETLSSIGISGEDAQISSNQTIGALVGALNDRNGFQKGWGNVTSGISMGFSKIFQGKNDQAKNYIQWMLTSDIFENLNDTSKYIAILTLAMEYANQNRLDAFNKGIQEFGQKDFSIASNEDLGKAVISTGLDKSYFESMGKKLKNAGWNLDGKMFEDIDAKKFGLEGINGFRYGLNKVPYDDFLARLHEGEAVLSASTANELRSLLDEYRQTSQQTVNFDTIIQQQTSDLLYKMDEIISTINGVNVNTANYKENQGKGKTLVKNSMTKIQSTKSF